MLIRGAELRSGRTLDVRIAGDSVAAVADRLTVEPGETVLEANGAALLPGLHDHHLHLFALAGALESLHCGPPAVLNEIQLAQRLRERAATDASTRDEWIRGIGYHESVAGDIDCAWLDRVVPGRPVRIQHRSGRLWIINSRGLALLGPGDEAPATGRLYDADPWLRARLGSRPPALQRASALLASYGITGVTDAGARNSTGEYRYFADATACGELLQRVVVMGDASLDGAIDSGLARRGQTKIYLRESALPTTGELCATIERSHAAGRAVAVHCVTETEIVFAVAAIGMAGRVAGDRIEHASIAPPAVLALLAEHDLAVVTQPNFVRERGDAYLAEVPARDHPWLYRARGFLDAGIALAGGTDAPLGDPNPWLAMHCAVERHTAGGRALGEAEALSPEEALALFGGDPLAPGRAVASMGHGSIHSGSPADLCLLDRPWSAARRNLAAVEVVATLRGGHLIWQRA